MLAEAGLQPLGRSRTSPAVDTSRERQLEDPPAKMRAATERMLKQNVEASRDLTQSVEAAAPQCRRWLHRQDPHRVQIAATDAFRYHAERCPSCTAAARRSRWSCNPDLRCSRTPVASAAGRIVGRDLWVLEARHAASVLIQIGMYRACL